MQEMQETWVQSLVQEDPLEKGKAAHSSILFLFVCFVPYLSQPILFIYLLFIYLFYFLL